MRGYTLLFPRSLAKLSVMFCIALLALLPRLFAQESIELAQAFLDIQNDAVVMNISAHPDDEDGATLAYYRMKFGVKTYSILFTRGEGGQNEIGPELYEELGVLRTKETQEAGAILGAEVHFLNFKDFGYSKTATETFKKWGGPAEPLRRLVFAIRKYKPDVIFTNHSTVEGHGHHQVVAITAIAAFDAAADSTYFPEQLKIPGISIWQPRKLYARNFGRSDLTADVVNQIGETNPTRKLSYLDIASHALEQHKTQGMDRADLRRFTRGLSLYRLVRSNSIYEKDTTTFLGGINLWNDPSLSSLRSTREQVSHMHRGMSLDSLIDMASMVDRIASRRIALLPLAARVLSQWQEEIAELVKQSCGITASWSFADAVVVRNQKVASSITIESSSCKLNELSIQPVLPAGWSAKQSDMKSTARIVSANREVTIGESPTFTVPQTVSQYNSLESEENVFLQARVRVNGKPITLFVRPTLDVAPEQTLSVAPRIAWLSTSSLREGKRFEFHIKNYTPNKSAGRVTVEVPPGWSAQNSSYVIAREDSSASGSLVVFAPEKANAGEYRLRFKTDFAVDDVVVKVFDVVVDKNVHLGIIKSYDNTLESAADALGMQYSLLEAKDLEADLSSYTTIVIDIRAYLIREDLKRNNRRLLDYVKGGGNLVVMYHKDQEWKSEYAPFPMNVSRKRVSVEEAPIIILKPDHPLLNSPNKITPADWDGWIQERGVYYPGNVAPEYTQLLSSNDPDEEPLRTGYLVADYGRGSYIYTSYVWYRQMKENHPGALRCFINMIAYPNHKAKP